MSALPDTDALAKLLDWESFEEKVFTPPNDSLYVAKADTPFCTYFLMKERGKFRFSIGHRQYEPGDFYATEVEAKAAVQADFNARVRNCLAAQRIADAARIAELEAEAKRVREQSDYDRRQSEHKSAVIDKLNARIAELTAALVEIEGSSTPDHWVPQYQHCVDIASEALARP